MKKAEEAIFQTHLKDILTPNGILDSHKNGYHRIFQIYEIPNSFPERVGILNIPIEEARLAVSVGGDLPHIDVADIKEFLEFYQYSIDTIVKNSLSEGPQKIGFSFIMDIIDHTVITEDREFPFNSYQTVSMADHKEHTQNMYLQFEK